jgi:DNA-binding response OmpR family regulator
MTSISTRNRQGSPLPPLPPGLDVYRPAEVMGSVTLVVEDEAPMRTQLEIDLQDLGYQVRSASSPPEAMGALQRERVAAVLLDLILEEDEQSGFELLQRIRENHPGLPVLVLSAAQASSAAVRRAYELGASSYFVKGQNTMAHVYSDLAARIVEGGQGRHGHYRFGRLDFDPARRTMSLGGRRIRLTSQQTALIVYLAQGSKSATAGDLIEAGLFRPDAARSTVHSALLTLRRKLDELEPNLGSRFLLSTPRGYSLGPLV